MDLRPIYTKTAFPNLDPIFQTGFPYALFGGGPFEAMRRRPGINHIWVYAAASTIIRNYVQCPLRLRKKADIKGVDLIDSDPLLDLFQNPNPHMNGTNILEAVAWCLLLPTFRGSGGQAFLWGANRENFRKGQLPDELWVQGDNGVKPRLNTQDILLGWDFAKSEASPYNYGEMYLANQEVVRLNYFNPYNSLEGVSPGHVLRGNVDQDATAMEFTTNFLKNHPTMSGLFTSKKFLNQGQVEELKASIDKYAKGPKNAGNINVLPAELEYQSMGLNEEDFSHLSLLGWTRDSTLAAYQVSKFAVQQYEDLNYATAKEADRQLFKAAIQPMDSMIMSQLNAAWVRYYGKGDLLLCTDFSNITALKDDMDARVKRAQILEQMGIPTWYALKMCSVPVDELDEKAMPWLLENSSPAAAIKDSLTPADDNDGTPGKGLKKKAVNWY